MKIEWRIHKWNRQTEWLPELRVGAKSNTSPKTRLYFQDDEDEDIDFEDMFSQLSKMKDISKNLPESERRAYAEKVAIAFYKSMGGSDSDEAEG